MTCGGRLASPLLRRHAARPPPCLAETGTPMRFAVFVPPQAKRRARCRWCGSSPGLTCTEENFTVKAGAQRVAAELGLMLVAPDTSPRGEGVPDDPEGLRLRPRRRLLRGCDAGALGEALPHALLHRAGAARAGRAELPGRHGPPGHHRPFHGRPWRADHRAAQSRPVQGGLRLRAHRLADALPLGREGAWRAISAPTAPPGANTTPPR